MEKEERGIASVAEIEMSAASLSALWFTGGSLSVLHGCHAYRCVVLHGAELFVLDIEITTLVMSVRRY